MPSAVLVRAPEAIENLGATERERQTAWFNAENLTPVYTADPAVWTAAENNLQRLRHDLDAIRIAYVQERETLEYDLANWETLITLMNTEADQLRIEWEIAYQAAVEAGVPEAERPPTPEIPLPPAMPEWHALSFNLFNEIPLITTEIQRNLIVEMMSTDYDYMWDAIDASTYNIQANLPIHEIDFNIQRQVEIQLANWPWLLAASRDLAEHIILSNIMPNAIPNDAVNQENFERVSQMYEHIWVQEGEILVDQGQIVTEDVFEMMRRLGLIRPDSIMDSIVPLIGVYGLVLLLFLACIMYLYFYSKTMSKNRKEAALLFTLYILTLGLAWTLSEFPYPFLPLLIFPMLVSMLIDRRIAIMLSCVMVIICYFIIDGSLTFLLFYTTGGILISLLSRFTTERAKVFIVGLMVTAIQFVLSITIALIVGHNLAIENLTGILTTGGFAALSGMLTVIICTGSLPFWETFFGVVTPVKLLDLTNPTNTLLRRLTIEAPGTYHHSLIVANLAETAAYDIGANNHAARVGGYYHDVGKLKFPHYFAENLDGENPHDNLDPANSTQIIISHVSYGLQLAEENKLPTFVKDIIREHHGTTVLQYFYAKAKETNPDAKESDFRYPYIIPQSRESACVMLADSVEAAVRSMIPKISSVDEVEKAIRNIIRGKLNDGQLADSQLSIKDVLTIEQSFFRVLKGMYHERIAYPKISEDTAPIPVIAARVPVGEGKALVESTVRSKA